jgi:hypothetical protein
MLTIIEINVVSGSPTGAALDSPRRPDPHSAAVRESSDTAVAARAACPVKGKAAIAAIAASQIAIDD